jgi:hypothetical protein
MRVLRLAVLFVLLVGCGSDESKPVDAGAVDTLAPADTNKSDGIDCSTVGCAPPPPCGQPCTEPCGCCPNVTCDGG